MADQPICKIEDCGKTAIARGWCEKHYCRWKAHGDPLAGGTGKGELLRYLNEVVIPYDGDECLPWPYATNGAGYCQVKINGERFYVHRLVCEESNGPPPTPLHQAAHSCGNGHIACVTKRHLSWKTPVENEADKMAHGTYWQRGRPPTKPKPARGSLI